MHASANIASQATWEPSEAFPIAFVINAAAARYISAYVHDEQSTYARNRLAAMLLDARGCERNVNKALRLLDRSCAGEYAPVSSFLTSIVSNGGI